MFLILTAAATFTSPKLWDCLALLAPTVSRVHDLMNAGCIVFADPLHILNAERKGSSVGVLDEFVEHARQQLGCYGVAGSGSRFHHAVEVGRALSQVERTSPR